LGLAALSYDSPEILASFAKRRGIEFPLLADPDSEILSQLGLVNTEAEDMARGVAHPGILWLDGEGRLKEKFFEESYRDRLTAETLLGRMFPELVMSDVPFDSQSGEVQFRTSVAGSNLIMGSETDLLLEIQIPEGSHLYGEGAEGYLPLKLELEPHPWLEFGSAVLPEPEALFMPAIQETAPVYEGHLLLRVPVKVTSRDVAKLEEEQSLKIGGTVKYQVCTETQCFLPTDQSLSWTVRLLPFDRARSPEQFRHQ
jgi:hypothetical protein